MKLHSGFLLHSASGAFSNSGVLRMLIGTINFNGPFFRGFFVLMKGTDREILLSEEVLLSEMRSMRRGISHI